MPGRSPISSKMVWDRRYHSSAAFRSLRPDGDPAELAVAAGNGRPVAELLLDEEGPSVPLLRRVEVSPLLGDEAELVVHGGEVSSLLVGCPLGLEHGFPGLAVGGFGLVEPAPCLHVAVGSGR